jgi:hypothetical protein
MRGVANRRFCTFYEKRHPAGRRFQLHFVRPSRMREKPETILICARMRYAELLAADTRIDAPKLGHDEVDITMRVTTIAR